MPLRRIVALFIYASDEHNTVAEAKPVQELDWKQKIECMSLENYTIQQRAQPHSRRTNLVQINWFPSGSSYIKDSRKKNDMGVKNKIILAHATRAWDRVVSEIFATRASWRQTDARPGSPRAKPGPTRSEHRYPAELSMVGSRFETAHRRSFFLKPTLIVLFPSRLLQSLASQYKPWPKIDK